MSPAWNQSKDLSVSVCWVASRGWPAGGGTHVLLRLAGVLVDDVRGDGLLLLLLLPHQQDALVDEDVLLLSAGPRGRC